MDSSSKLPKQPKGIRKWMDKLSVSRSGSRSTSPSGSSHQPAPGTLPPLVELDGVSSGPMVGPSDTPSITADATVPAAPAVDDGSRIPIVVKPHGEGSESGQENMRKDNEKLKTGTSAPNLSPTEASREGHHTKSVLRSKLRTSLEMLQQSCSLFPPLSSALGILLSCVDELEVLSQHKEDYEEMAVTLSAMSDSLNQHTSSIWLSDSMTKLGLSLEQEAKQIQKVLEQIKARGARDAITGEDAMLRHYRRNTRLDGLRPVKQATYDSNLSTEVSPRGCTQGTRETVLAGLHSWLNDSDSASVYWMNGMAGTGKTTIAYTFCEQSEAKKQLAASFFCTRNAVDCRSTSKIVPSIAYQLALYSIPYQSALCRVLEQHPDIGSKHIVKQFEQLLKDPLQQVKDAVPSHLVVVIDALDECADRNGVELILDMLFRWAGQVPLKFLVTSRPEPEIFAKMRLHEQSRAVIHLHDIETSLVRADIELYLNEVLAFVSLTQAEVEQLSHRAGSLFIYAATLVRYILYGKRVANPRHRLQSVLSLASESSKKHAEIDALYTAILESALQEAEMEDQESEDIKAVLRTVLFAQEPIDVDTIAVLGGLGDHDRVTYALQPLRSVVRQSEITGLVSTLHASFPDFLLSRNRSGAFFCDAVEYSQVLAERCFESMRSELRFNICGLESSYLPDNKVNGLPDRIKANISPTLGYVCRYWASHLGMAKKSGALMKMLSDFLSHRLLFWMEVLNLKQAIQSGMDMLQRSDLWVNQIGSPVSREQLLKLVKDSYTFITHFTGSSASQSTPHIYISCLPFCSRSSEVYKCYWERIRGLLQLQGSLIDRRDSAALASWTDEKFMACAISPNGTHIIGGVGDGVMIRNVYNGASLVESMLGHTGWVDACTFSLDGTRAASASRDGSIRVWDAYNGTLIAGPFECKTSLVQSPALTKHGATAIPPFQSDGDFITSIALSHDGTHIAISLNSRSTVYLLDGATGVLIRSLQGHIDKVTKVVMSPDGSLLASACRVVRLWKVEDGSAVGSPYEGHSPDQISCLTFTLDGTRIISCSNMIHVWRVSDGSVVAKFGVNLDTISLTVSPDSMHVASGSRDCTILIWRVDDGTLVSGPFYARNYGGFSGLSDVTQLKYTPDGTRLISRVSDGTVAIWSMGEDKLSQTPSTPRYPICLIDALIFSDDGSRILARGSTLVNLPEEVRLTPHAADGFISTWSMRPSSDRSSRYPSHTDRTCSAIEVPAGGKYTLTPDQIRKTITSWDPHDGSFTEVPDEAYHFPDTFLRHLTSPNGLYTVTFIQGTLQREVITTSDQSVILQLDKPAFLIASQFSRDSSAIAVGSDDGLISIWDLQSRQVIAGPFSGHSLPIRLVALSPDGSLLASISIDDTLRIFDARNPVISVDTTLTHNIDTPYQTQMYDGWSLGEDGWVKNSSSDLLFWVPLEFKPAWPSPHTSIVVTRNGIVQVPKQKLLLGEQWHKCYISGSG